MVLSRACVDLIDGTSVSILDTAANQSTYPQQGAQQPGLGFPVGCIVGVLCLSSSAILDTTIEWFNRKVASEHDLLRSILNIFESGDIVLRDTFYGGYTLLAAILKKNVDVVFEQMGLRKKKTDFRKG